MSVAEFNCIPGVTISRERRAASGYGTDGRWIELAPTVVAVEGVAHPATSQKSLSTLMIREIDNNRGREMQVIYSVPDTWQEESEALQTKADLCVINGTRFEVMMIDKWRSGVLDHDKVLVARLDLRDVD